MSWAQEEFLELGTSGIRANLRGKKLKNYKKWQTRGSLANLATEGPITMSLPFGNLDTTFESFLQELPENYRELAIEFKGFSLPNGDPYMAFKFNDLPYHPNPLTLSRGRGD